MAVCAPSVSRPTGAGSCSWWHSECNIMKIAFVNHFYHYGVYAYSHDDFGGLIAATGVGSSTAVPVPSWPFSPRPKSRALPLLPSELVVVRSNTIISGTWSSIGINTVRTCLSTPHYVRTLHQRGRSFHLKPVARAVPVVTT